MNTIRQLCCIFVNFCQGLFNWSSLTSSVHLSGSSGKWLWVIGLFVSIQMIIDGWAVVMLSTAAREEIKEVRRLVL